MKNESDSEYEIRRTIGKGNFGKVLLGISKKTGEKVAIKIIDKLKVNKTYNSEQIKREINIIQKMEHLNIIKIYRVENDLMKYKIIMEFCEKGELYEHIVKEKKLKQEEAAYFYFQLINGLEYIHSKSIVHRDLKPENLLITNNNILKIIDFGLCNYHDINKLLSTPCGSPSYASPEMVSGNNYDGILVDIWCTGIILFAMLSGYLPFEADDNYSLFKKIIKCEINYPSNISETSLDLIQKILVKEPKKRINIAQIKKHPFYLEGKKIFEETHREYIIKLENSNKKRLYSKFNSNGQFTNRKFEGKKNIFFIRKNFKNNIIKDFDKINLLENNLNYRNSFGESLKKNIPYFNVSLENNKKKKFDKNKLNKDNRIKRKNILNSNQNELDTIRNNKNKICLTENNDDKEIIKYIKPIMSPNNTERKILFNYKYFYESSHNRNNYRKFYNSKMLDGKNYSPSINSIGPYKRPKLRERTISLKKDNYENSSSPNKILKSNNITINNSPNLSERKSLIINNIKKYNKNERYKLINNSFIYQHKSFNAYSLKDDKIINEKNNNISNNSIEKNYERNNYLNNDLNIYYTLNSSQTIKKKNFRNNILFFNIFHKKIDKNKERNLYSNIKNISSQKKYNNNILNINNRRNNIEKNNLYYHGKTIDISENNIYINKKIDKINISENFEENISKNEKKSNKNFIQNNKTKNKLLSYHKKLFIKKHIINNKNLNKIQNKKTEISNLKKGKKKINALIFNNQINQVNIFKNDNNINSYNLNSIYFYSNPMEIEQNELDLKKILVSKNHLKTIAINKRCETEANDFQSISSHKNIMKKRIYKISKKNPVKEFQLNNDKIKTKKALANSLFPKEVNKIIRPGKKG